MQKIIIVRWDMKLGPQILVQFPPEADFPSKEILLKLWAHHELKKDSNFVTLVDNIENQYYCSLLKTDVRKNLTFLLILKLSADSKMMIYREILENVAEEVINNLNSTHFTHILADTYRIIINQSEMDETHLFYRLFQDKNRIEIFQILRQGVITKSALRNLMKKKWGVTNINLDLLISPFLRLGLIKIKDVPGAKECIFLIHDVYCCRLPPSHQNLSTHLIQKIQQTLELDPILTEGSSIPLMKLMQTSGIKELMDLLKNTASAGIPSEVALAILKENEKYLDALETNLVIHISPEKRVYLLSHLHFQKFPPKYLPQILTDRYLGEAISFDQMLAHIALLKQNFSSLL